MKLMTIDQFRQDNKRVSTDPENYEQIDKTVLEIIQNVRSSGDNALFQYTKKFDGINLDQLTVSQAEFAEAGEKVSNRFLTALEQANKNITAFHENQKEHSWFTNPGNGIMLGQKVSPLEKVGIYVPGGKAAYPSTVLMNVIPAKLAGVKKVVITTPPGANGKISPEVLTAAKLTGVDKVYKIGGAQAIAALAYGTESIDKVVKIVGPGNAFVARAKKWVYGDVDIDMIAGPSEICVVADATANPDYVAADLLSQAEHDERASAICIATDPVLAEQVKASIIRQAAQLERKEIIQQSLKENGKIIIADNLANAFGLVNELAPEHLQLMVENPFEKLSQVKHAGAIFLGHYAPEPLGDYVAGPNHTLPTSGTAVFSSPLGVYDFLKKSSIIHYSEQALQKTSDSIITLAKAEGLTAHANSIQIRKGDYDA
ncbi:histidinol dehydrogenase [Virgibacillus siamensis]|uniref:histidinol dehydrogenase n=1 Tax=Virgibacillus siamensis TaxID=480071 RepID=UPI000985B988|nr:histidinol dehydrogenase [Virgibacillus siamensis]